MLFYPGNIAFLRLNSLPAVIDFLKHETLRPEGRLAA
jgi:hypothetical protein